MHRCLHPVPKIFTSIQKDCYLFKMREARILCKTNIVGRTVDMARTDNFRKRYLYLANVVVKIWCLRLTRLKLYNSE